MKRGIGYTICTNLILAIFIGALVSTNPVSAYQSLGMGDQLLYYADYTHIEDFTSSMLYEPDLSPSYNSYYDINHYEFTAVELHSYTIGNAYASDYDVRHTWSFFDTYRNDYWDTYYYDYMADSWIYNYGGSDSYLFSGSNTYYENYPYQSPIINLDPEYSFSATIFDYQTSKTYDVNGNSKLYTVDVFNYNYGSSGNNTYSYYDVFYEEYYDYSYDITYYVDNATGFLLEMEINSYDHYWHDYDTLYSSTLGANITSYYDSVYQEYKHYYLMQTTVGGLSDPAVFDADLPGIEWDWMYSYDITGTSNWVDLFFWIYDSNPVDIEVYLDGTHIDTLYGWSPGYHMYSIYTGDIPVSPMNHEVRFRVTDIYDGNHTTEWNLWMYDQRIDWPQINGPSGDYWYEIGNTETLYWQLKDDNMDPQYFEYKFEGVILDDGLWFDGKTLGINLHDNIFSPGDYYVHIFANDTMGHESYLDLIIHANYTFDGTPPTVSSPSDITMKPGEDKKIKWSIYDENPYYYRVKQNGTIIINTPWHDVNFDVNVYLSSLTLGTYVYEIEVEDVGGNFAYDEVWVFVTEEGNTNPTTNGTEPTNSNTVTLDAPSIVYVAVAFLSFAALTVIIRRRR